MRTGRQAGFTLIEVIVVLVVLGLLVGLVISRGPGHSVTLDLRAASRTIAGTLRRARAAAIATDRPTTFVLDVVNHGFRVDNGPVQTLSPSIALSMLTIAGATSGGQLAALRFAPDGSSTGGRIALSAGERRIDVNVDWLTGRVSIADGR